MSYVSSSFAGLVLGVLVLYYLLPVKRRYLALCVGSLLFVLLSLPSIQAGLLFLLTCLYGYAASLALERERERRGAGIAALVIVPVFVPLLAVKVTDYIVSLGGDPSLQDLFPRPVGLSFYTLVLAAYLVDIWHGKCRAEHHFLKYALFLSFFPTLLQGPLLRFQDEGEMLSAGHRFRDRFLTRGLSIIAWGLFLKLCIADKAALLVDSVFAAPESFSFPMAALAAVLYSIQLYADFSSCVCLSIGTSELFGIRLPENFRRPYFADSIRDFWRRWHITLSLWLRDYVYIPLGGSRKGRARKIGNVLVTFLVSGFWHGGSPAFLVWGLLHGLYQTVEELLGIGKKKRKQKQNPVLHVLRVLWTFLLVTFAWVIFRAGDLQTAGLVLSRIFLLRKTGLTFAEELGTTGMDGKDLVFLLAAVFVLFLVSLYQERRGKEQPFALTDRIFRLPAAVPMALLLSLAAVILVFGTYGTGFDAKEFIYGEF